MISEVEKEAIRKEAQAILAKFAKTLDSVKASKEKKLASKVSGTRVEVGASVSDLDFRKRMFDNSPKNDEDCIVAEKASW